MTPRRKLRQSLALCLIALAIGAYDRIDEVDEPKVETTSASERVAIAPQAPHDDPATVGTSDETDHQSEEILAF